MNSSAIITISKDEDVKLSLNRAINFLSDIKLKDYKGRFYKDWTVIYLMESEENLVEWLCGEFRVRALSPLIVIGTEDKGEFYNKFPLFKDYSEEHKYIQIPFEIDELVEAIRSVKPIYDHATRRILYNDHCKNYEYKLITHDLKIIENDRNKTIEHFRNVLNYYKICGLRATADKIEKTLKEIATNDNWVELSERLKAELLERCKRRHGQ